ncbi:hypothetical protein [Virgibacillus oceani]|uniref:Uncharacterized protein n=1 Tax=Virgibacillus oceani TaxID=1479511 RepID=A0A917HK90_9BACI|nr:hypothetical protein [Virgibacillus oceani]GGG81779.1 hypothetical protein GCM10011398_29100 [Virgibacillus oceani]
MDNKDIEKQVIESYQNDEKMMILIYAQWCINNGHDPRELYQKAYPDQMKNAALNEALELTVSKEESEEIPNQTVINVLQLFGNDDLAFLVQAEIDQANKNKKLHRH